MTSVPPRPAGLLWLAALGFALGFLALDSGHRIRTLSAISGLSLSDAAIPVSDPTSRTGYEAGQHRLILPTAGTDGYHWILQTEGMLAGEGLRIRNTEADNAPDGRAVHWSSLPRWWLAVAAQARRVVRPELSAPQSLEQVAAGAGALALAVLLLVVTPLLVWRLGSVPASLFALGWVCVFPLYETFMAGIVDHHGFLAMSAFGGLILLVMGGAGWVREGSGEGGHRLPIPDATSARRRFVAAGVVSGIGLWISAATMIPLIVATGVGAVVAAAVPGRATPIPTGGRRGAGIRVEPGLWRVWGAAGCATALAAYALEYAPGPFEMRMEVNHPLYALAWLATGDLVTRACRLLSPPRLIQPAPATSAKRQWPGIATSLLVAGVPAAVVLATGGAAFGLADPFLRTLHMGYIREFQGLAVHLSGLSVLHVLQSVSALPLVLLPVTAMVIRARGERPADSARLLMAAVPAAGLLALTFWQVRWLATASAALLVVLVTAAALGETGAAAWRGLRRTAAAGLLLLVLAPFPVTTVLFPWRFGYPGAEEVPQVVARDVAHWLRARVGTQAVVVASPPVTTTWLVYFGGFQGLGTLYWENVEGLRASAALFSASDEFQAWEVVEGHGVTHLLIPSWETFEPGGPSPYLDGGSGRRIGASPGGENTFLSRIAASDSLPDWLLPSPYAVPSSPALRDATVRLYEVRPRK